jgi:DNA-binding GntR family transcriptional regulator
MIAPRYRLRVAAPLDFSGIADEPDVYRWQAIAAVIEAAIRSGDLPPRSLVPSESQLMGLTGCGRKTVRHAVHDLRDRGLLYTVPSLGTFVSRDMPPG